MNCSSLTAMYEMDIRIHTVVSSQGACKVTYHEPFVKKYFLLEIRTFEPKYFRTLKSDNYSSFSCQQYCLKFTSVPVGGKRNNMERLYCLLVTAFLLLCQLLVISCAFIIILDAVDIMLYIHTIISQANAIVACALKLYWMQLIFYYVYIQLYHKQMSLCPVL